MNRSILKHVVKPLVVTMLHFPVLTSYETLQINFTSEDFNYTSSSECSKSTIKTRTLKFSGNSCVNVIRTGKSQ
jgi:hypothetical protein